MTSTVDYTPIILAQLTDLQGRVTKQDAVIAALLAAVERLSGQTITVSDTMRTSVPLRSNESATGFKRGRPQVAGARPQLWKYDRYKYSFLEHYVQIMHL